MANANIPSGDYYILNAREPGRALDAGGYDDPSGNTLRLATVNFSDAQVFRITNRNGQYEILSRWTGKSIDVYDGDTTNGNKIWMWHDNDTLAQRWTFEERSGDISYNGKTYKQYYIHTCLGNRSKVLEPFGWQALEGAPIDIFDKDEGRDQSFILVPLPAFRPGMIYEIRPLGHPQLSVGVANGSTASGANVELVGASDQNSNKWIVHKTSKANVFRFQNLKSKMFLDLNDANAEQTENIKQFRENTGPAQEWYVVDYGMTKFNGVDVPMWGIATNVDRNYFMDLYYNSGKPGSNIWIIERNQTTAQRFLIIETNETDSSVPGVHSLGIGVNNKTAGVVNLGTPLQSVPIRYYWRIADSWMAEFMNSFQLRHRKRTMFADGSYGPWSGFTNWATTGIRKDGKNCWGNGVQTCELPVNGVWENGSWKTKPVKGVQYNFEVVGVVPGTFDKTKLMKSKVASAVCSVHFRPTITVAKAVIGPLGLGLTLASNAHQMISKVYVNGLSINGKYCKMTAVYTKSFQKETGAFISAKYLPIDIVGGESATMNYDIGTASIAKFGVGGNGLTSAGFKIESNGGTVTPNIEIKYNDNHTATLTANDLGTTKAWLSVGDIRFDLLGSKKPDGKVEFIVPYPFAGRKYSVTVGSTNSSETSWYTKTIETACPEDNIGYGWYTDYGKNVTMSLSLEKNLVHTTKLASDFATYIVNGATRERVRFGSAKKGSWTATGVVDTDLIPSEKREAIVELASTHCWFRDPYGDIYRVAVTDVTSETNDMYSKCAVTMVEEAYDG